MSNRNVFKNDASPFGRKMNQLFEVMDRDDAEEYMMIVGVNEDEEDHGYDGDTKLLTQEQVDRMRFVLGTPNRMFLFEQLEDLLTAGQANSGISMYNTTTGNRIVAAIENQIQRATKSSTKPHNRFDNLFVLTSLLDDTFEETNWLVDNECGEDNSDDNKCDMILKKLATAWKETLRLGDPHLRIDSEYTRKAIPALLRKFQGKIHLSNTDHGTHYVFHWEEDE